MKKVRIIAALCMIAMLFVACSPAPEKDEPAKNPTWAVGEYEGKVSTSVMGQPIEMDGVLNITETGFAISINNVPMLGTLNIDSASDGVSIVKSEEADNTWSLGITGIVVENFVEATDEISITVTEEVETGNLIVNVVLSSLTSLPISGTFGPVAAEPVPEN